MTDLLHNKKQIILLIFLITICLSFHPGLGGEEWGYWFFNRLFKETWRFTSLDRSTLYVLYLTLFSWLDYPYSVIIESFCTFSIGIIIYYFFANCALHKEVGYFLNQLKCHLLNKEFYDHNVSYPRNRKLHTCLYLLKIPLA